MKKTKIQIKSIFGKVIFEHEKEDNTIKETVIAFLENFKGELMRNVNLSGMWKIDR